jgi:hypothetical protein
MVVHSYRGGTSRYLRGFLSLLVGLSALSTLCFVLGHVFLSTLFGNGVSVFVRHVVRWFSITEVVRRDVMKHILKLRILSLYDLSRETSRGLAVVLFAWLSRLVLN